MRVFDLQIMIPNYTPEQAVQMHMDEAFQAEAAPNAGASRTLEMPGHDDGSAYTRTAIFDTHGDAPEGFLQTVLKSATPQIRYREISHYYSPPHGTTDVQVLAPEVASECVAVHVDMQFDPTQGGTVCSLHGEINVGGWVPAGFRELGERVLTSQLTARLTQAGAHAQQWAVRYPERYKTSTT